MSGRKLADKYEDSYELEMCKPRSARSLKLDIVYNDHRFNIEEKTRKCITESQLLIETR